ncbi:MULTISPECIES: hypothetical protein [Mesorhizobium]|uniref:Uncharacterized protein n=1 Tax=Mesorhizobium denitrificans TaxID=2294114 RepID=A0A371X9A1_9HYPH|nr:MULTISPECIES: hypothetical protein [Mesorhizobium]RFC65624.1 hypothetical protein DY251_17775 [Mesorhizobium denitrificans]
MEHGLGQDAGRPQAQEEISGAEPRLHAAPYHCRHTPDGYDVLTDMSENLPVTHEEIALLRAFLSAEISAIIHGDNEAG